MTLIASFLRRSQTPRAALLLMPGLAFAGCAYARQPARPASAMAYSATYVYLCSEGFRFSARFRGDSAVVELPARVLRLPLVVSASGAKYEADGVVFWTKGERASLQVGAATYDECEGVRAGT